MLGGRPRLRRACQLRANVTGYDPACAALARALGRDLLIANGRLANASGLLRVI
jgi:predicted nucleic acid-binding protein